MNEVICNKAGTIYVCDDCEHAIPHPLWPECTDDDCPFMDEVKCIPFVDPAPYDEVFSLCYHDDMISAWFVGNTYIQYECDNYHVMFNSPYIDYSCDKYFENIDDAIRYAVEMNKIVED